MSTRRSTASVQKTKSESPLIAYLSLTIFVVVAVMVLPLKKIPQFVEAEVISYSTETPSEVMPGESYAWRGQANDPKKITITSVGINGFFQNVGIDQNQQIAVPNNIFFAGWFVDSVRPGEKGLSIIDGHIDGRDQNGGIFRGLPLVNKGDEATIVFGDNSVKHFKVFAKQEVSMSDAATVLYSQDPKVTIQLNLITCVGNYDSAVRSYDQRLIVSLELIN